MTRILSVFNLLKRVGFAVLLLGVLADAAQADTTWVSGQTGGVWTAENSPFMITGAAWVDSVVGLTIEGGCQIIMSSGSDRFELRGRVTFAGSDTMPIATWIPFQSCLFSEQPRARYISLKHVYTYGQGGFDLKADSILVDSCSLQSTDHHGNSLYTNMLEGNLVECKHTFFHSLTIARAITLVHDCEFSRVLYITTGAATVDSVRWIPGQSTVDGKIVLTPTTRFSTIILRDCSCAELSGTAGLEPEMPIELTRLQVTRRCDIDHASDVQIEECIIPYLNLISVGGEVHRSIINEARLFLNSFALSIHNNTFIYDECCFGERPPSLLHVAGDIACQFSNNIIVSNNNRSKVFSGFSPALVESHFNLTFGMDDPWDGHNVSNDNIDANPLFDPNDTLYRLTSSSPAINAGNPLALDEDGTVSDIGAQWWDHRLNHPPIITTPNRITTRWGDRFVFEVSASDESGVHLSINAASSAWFMFPRHLDDAYGRLFDGYVPFGVENFDLEVIAIDDHGQRDHENINVQVNPVSVLPPNVSGILLPEFSPYIAYQDVTISHRDSLTIQSGVTIIFSDRDCQPYLNMFGSLISIGADELPVRIMAENGGTWRGIRGGATSGSLNLRYTELLGSRRLCIIDTTQSVLVDHCTFETIPDGTGASGISFGSIADTVQLTSCEFGNTQLSLFDVNYSIDSCTFEGSSEGIQFYATASSGIIQNSSFLNVAPHSSIQIWTGSLTMERCGISQTQGSEASAVVLTNGLGTDPTRLEVLHTTFWNLNGIGVNCSNSVSEYVMTARFVNTIFEGITGTAIHCFQIDPDDILLDNNCFYVSDQIVTGVNVPSFHELDDININGDSIDTFGNIFLDPILDESGVISITSPCIDAGLDIGEPYIGPAPDIGGTEIVGLFPPSGVNETSYDHNTIVSPNPFNPTTTLSFSLLKSSLVELTVYDVLGRAVMSHELGMLNAGVHDVVVDGAEWSSGVYFASVSAGEWREVVKMALVR